jgi:Ser/Thr protein kinase RdoA (MazF antagonist)
VKPLEPDVPYVLANYPDVSPGEFPHSLGHHGGFSGAHLWRVRQGSLCLKAWPVNGMTAQYLTHIHAAMRVARAAGLPFVPEVFSTRDGQSVVKYDGWLWDVTTWMPGTADFHQHPSVERVQAACLALARLHAVWARDTTAGACPAVLRRIQAAARWQQLLSDGWRPEFTYTRLDPVQPWAERAWVLVLRHRDGLTNALLPYADALVSTHPCLCDVWHDHILFRDQEVSGVVDYGCLKRDHVAVDLARLLGSLVGDNKAWWTAGLESYRKVRPLDEWEERLVEMLDRTGTVLAAANWLLWLYYENRRYFNRQAVARRLAAIVQRLGWEKD